MMVVKLFSDRSYLPQGTPHVTMLIPFWGTKTQPAETIDKHPYDAYRETGASFFSMTTLDHADLAVLPSDWDFRHQQKLEQFIDLARKAHKPVILFFWGDTFDTIPVQDAYVFRTSFHRSTRGPTEYAVPVWSDDFVDEYLDHNIPVRPKADKPTISFCGFADPIDPTPKDRVKKWLRYGKALLKMQIGHNAGGLYGRAIRTRAMQLLRKSPGLKTNFIVRDRYWAGTLSPDGTANLEQMQVVRQEYVRNMVDSDYVLCARGAGNFSFRLYEALSCGRIPIFIDTDCVLPYDFAVDWKQYCVWVDQSELPYIAEKVIEFHRRLSPSDFEELQRACRRFWEQWLSPVGFFANFHRHFPMLSAELAKHAESASI